MSVGLQHPEVMNAIPVPIFLVDDDVRILDMNAAASSTFGVSRADVYSRRGGDALHCLYAQQARQGCGHAPSCHQCVIRNSVTSSLKGDDVTRRRMKYETRNSSQRVELELLVSASRFPQAGDNAVLVVVEDFTELSRLRSIIPICTQCKRIRNQAEYWQQVEAYFHDYIGVDFTHGLCPECLTQVYGDYIQKPSPAK